MLLIAAFPNPFSKSITLQLNRLAYGPEDRVELYSQEGKLIYQRKLSPANGTTVLLNGIPAISKGIYFLKTVVNGKFSTMKLTKQ